MPGAASAGTGLLLPTLLTWAISGLSDEGRGTGMWTAVLFIGEFLCPLLVFRRVRTRVRAVRRADRPRLLAAVVAVGVRIRRF